MTCSLLRSRLMRGKCIRIISGNWSRTAFGTLCLSAPARLQGDNPNTAPSNMVRHPQPLPEPTHSPRPMASLRHQLSLECVEIPPDSPEPLHLGMAKSSKGERGLVQRNARSVSLQTIYAVTPPSPSAAWYLMGRAQCDRAQTRSPTMSCQPCPWVTIQVISRS